MAFEDAENNVRVLQGSRNISQRYESALLFPWVWRDVSEVVYNFIHYTGTPTIPISIASYTLIDGFQVISILSSSFEAGAISAVTSVGFAFDENGTTVIPCESF